MSRGVVKFNPAFRQVNRSKHRYRVMKGSAGSGKSVNVAQDFIMKLSDPTYKGANLLVVRKVDATHRNSTFAELQAAINRIFGDEAEEYWEVRQSPLMLRSKVTGNQIIFRGVNDARDREKLKSITFTKGKLTWIWIEEATEVMESDIDILDDRLRGILPNSNLYYQMTLTFNPVSATHFIKGKYFDIEHPDVLTHHSTYLNNRFIDEAYHRRMMMRKERDPEGYKIYGEGEWGETGGLILSNYTVHDFDTSHERFDVMTHGQDFGFNHANAILTVGFKDGELFVCHEIYVHEKDTGEIIQMAEGKLDKRFRMPCDSAEPDRIKTWKKAGYRAYPVKKEPGSVKAQIDFLKKHKIHIHPDCVNTLKEISQWKWKFDPKKNIYLDEPVDFFDDAMAALRYSIEDMRRGSSIAFE
ncbi:PBSX family phage terminase large subunit [Paenibacillus gansuensis]|uniref:PBSX family phage terminase large subunit n=1 Tax=Paenibacillus gansuensis TaxID=306542 RepID=A0ABW5PEI7_9BACL